MSYERERRERVTRERKGGASASEEGRARGVRARGRTVREHSTRTARRGSSLISPRPIALPRGLDSRYKARAQRTRAPVLMLAIGGRSRSAPTPPLSFDHGLVLGVPSPRASTRHVTTRTRMVKSPNIVFKPRGRRVVRTEVMCKEARAGGVRGVPQSSSPRFTKAHVVEEEEDDIGR